MFDRRALAAFQNQLNVAAQATRAESVALLRQTAKAERERVLREQRQRAGIAPTDITIPDGRRGAAIDTAEHQVIIEYGYLREVAQETLKALVARSPRRSGDYARSFVVLVGGAEVASLDAIGHGTPEVLIVNTSPYARRLEIGKSKDGTPFVVQVKPRIVEEVALTAASRFGNVAMLRFSYFDIDAAYSLRRSAGRRKDRRAGRAIRYPGIRITAR